jgi:hypothetical protein
MKAHGNVFGVLSREETINEEILSGIPSSKCVTFVQVDFWENERDKDNQHGVGLALLGFARQPIDPTHLMINRWCCGNIEFGRYWFGVLPRHVGYPFKTGYYKEPEAFPTRTSLRFEERKI